VPDDFGLCRFLAAGLATLAAVDAAVTVDLAALAEALDAEALRDGINRELFSNPAKALAVRMSGRPVVLAGDCPTTQALARHGAATALRVAGRLVTAAGVADAVVALRAGALAARAADSVDALFHDEEIDGPLPARPRMLALALALIDERQVLAARVAGFDDIDLVGVEDVEDAGSIPVSGGRTEQQLAILALRLEMAAVYLRLAAG
jgi:hypothetical protein